MLRASSGRGQYNALSRRPGLNRAGSNKSGLEEAATTATPSLSSTPSIWVNNWFTTLSVTPVLSWPRLE